MELLLSRWIFFWSSTAFIILLDLPGSLFTTPVGILKIGASRSVERLSHSCTTRHPVSGVIHTRTRGIRYNWRLGTMSGIISPRYSVFRRVLALYTQVLARNHRSLGDLFTTFEQVWHSASLTSSVPRLSGQSWCTKCPAGRFVCTFQRRPKKMLRMWNWCRIEVSLLQGLYLCA